jgi:hypothetical protein
MCQRQNLVLDLLLSIGKGPFFQVTRQRDPTIKETLDYLHIMTGRSFGRKSAVADRQLRVDSVEKVGSSRLTDC